MPELPEVETVRQDLARILIGHTFTRPLITAHHIAFPSREKLIHSVRGRQILELKRRGKYIIFVLSEHRALVVDLRMTGQLTIAKPHEPLPKHTHARFPFLVPLLELRFTDIRRFGRLIAFEGESVDSFFERRLGPEPFEIGPGELKSRLKGRKAAIKTTLLNQRIIAGLGNIYADEVLHAARIRPTKRAGRVTGLEIARLHTALHSILKEAIHARGSTLRNFVGGTGLAGSYQKRHRVFRLKGRPCPSCKTPIKMVRLVGRATHFCPTCQS